MHEMSYVIRIADQAIETAQAENAEKVNKLVVSVGEMTGVLPEYLKQYYGEAVKGTLLEGSVLETRIEPVQVLCSGCGHCYHPDRENGYACPKCSSNAGKITAGRDVVLEQLELM